MKTNVVICTVVILTALALGLKLNASAWAEWVAVGAGVLLGGWAICKSIKHG